MRSEVTQVYFQEFKNGIFKIRPSKVLPLFLMAGMSMIAPRAHAQMPFGGTDVAESCTAQYTKAHPGNPSPKSSSGAPPRFVIMAASTLLASSLLSGLYAARRLIKPRRAKAPGARPG